MDTDGEARRLARVYGRYANSARKRRAWDASNPGNLAIRRELGTAVVDTVLSRPHGDAVLDVGCGSGWVLRLLVEAGVAPERLHGVELLEHRVAAARASLPAARLAVADARQLPYDDATMGAVLFLTVLSSMPDEEAQVRALGEARRVLRPTGTIVTYEPAVGNPLNPATKRFTYRTAERAGLRVALQTSLTVVPAIARRLGSAAPRLYPVLARVPPLRTHRLTEFQPS